MLPEKESGPRYSNNKGRTPFQLALYRNAYAALDQEAVEVHGVLLAIPDTIRSGSVVQGICVILEKNLDIFKSPSVGTRVRVTTYCYYQRVPEQL